MQIGVVQAGFSLLNDAVQRGIDAHHLDHLRVAAAGAQRSGLIDQQVRQIETHVGTIALLVQPLGPGLNRVHRGMQLRNVSSEILSGSSAGGEDARPGFGVQSSIQLPVRGESSLKQIARRQMDVVKKVRDIALRKRGLFCRGLRRIGRQQNGALASSSTLPDQLPRGVALRTLRS